MVVKFVLYLWKQNQKITPVNYGRYLVLYNTIEEDIFNTCVDSGRNTLADQSIRFRINKFKKNETIDLLWPSAVKSIDFYPVRMIR